MLSKITPFWALPLFFVFLGLSIKLRKEQRFELAKFYSILAVVFLLFQIYFFWSERKLIMDSIDLLKS
jgi:hypothetical protein